MTWSALCSQCVLLVNWTVNLKLTAYGFLILCWWFGFDIAEWYLALQPPTFWKMSYFIGFKEISVWLVRVDLSFCMYLCFSRCLWKRKKRRELKRWGSLMQVIGSLRVGSVQYKHTRTLTQNQGWERGRYSSSVPYQNKNVFPLLVLELPFCQHSCWV